MTKPQYRVEMLPIFDDNYVFCLVDDASKRVVVVDPGEASTVCDHLSENQYNLAGVLITHHHNDHIGGVSDLIQKHSAPVVAPKKNRNQIIHADQWVSDGEHVQLGPFSFEVMELPGHTLGHVAYWLADSKWLFSGDVLFGLGCGRLFEGTYQQMYDSLQRLKKLPPETLVYCTHEYTETNLNFCKMLSNLDNSPITGDDEDLEIYENQLRNRRDMDLPSVPLKLSIEMKVNPFLLANSVQQFTYLRDLRNKQ